MDTRIFAERIEYAALDPFLKASELQSICSRAEQLRLHGVCVLPTYAAGAHAMLRRSPCRLICTVAYPYGANTTRIKLAEAAAAVKDGADILELVINHSAIMDRDDYFTANEIYAVFKQHNIPLRLMLEGSKLNTEQLDYCAKLAWDNGAEMLTLNTGLYSPASAEIIAALRSSCKKSMRLKAFGGIKTAAQCEELWQAGADLIATDAVEAIMTEFSGRG